MVARPSLRDGYPTGPAHVHFGATPDAPAAIRSGPSPSPTHHPIVPPLAERFTLGPLVGSGGSAEVFRATEAGSGRTVALKRWRALADDSIARARFEREARILADLDHPHVVRYVAHDTDAEGRLCLVTEWLEGETVDDLMARGRLNDWTALRIVQEAASGLAALHTAGVVHRDVKPANLFLAGTEDGAIVKVIDLGIAIGREDLTLTAEDAVVGSPVYVSPEQLRGEEPSPATNVYALALVFYELLTGQRPFGGADTMTLLRGILHDTPKPLRAVRPDLPVALDALLQRSMDKQPGRRPRRVTDFADEAAAILQGVTTHPDGVPAATLLGRSEQRVRVLVVGRASADATPFAMARLETALELHSARIEPEGARGLRGVFGDQRLRGDEAPRAARAALAARGKGLRIVIVSGPTIRTADGLDGECVRRAAALLGATDEGQVRVDEPTAVLLAQRFELAADARGATLFRAAPETPWVPARRDDTQSHDPPGREREVEMLAGLIHDTWQERAPRLVVLWGDAGIGKTRVAQAVAAQLGGLAAAENPRHPPGFLTLRGDPLLASTPYGAVRRAVREQCGIVEGDPPERQRQRAERALAAIPGAPAIEHVLELTRVPAAPVSSGRARAPAEPTAERPRDRTRATVLETLRAACLQSPQLMVLEDLHWLDETTCELCATLVDALWDLPFAVLALGRPEPDLLQRADRIWSTLPRTDLRLGPLPTAVSAALARECLPDDRDAALRVALVARAEGNPLFLDELLRAAQHGAWSANRTPDDVVLPVAAQAAVQLRLDALDSEARRVARAASVYGVTFWRRGLEALLGATPASGVDRALRDLESQGFLAPRPASRIVATAEYAFRHAMARDAAYATLLESDRRELHSRAADWLESTQAASSATLAQHRDLAGQRIQALGHWVAAAREALHDQAFDAARTYATRALARDPEPDVRREVLCVRADASFALADARTALADARAAESVPNAPPPARLRVALCVAQSQSLQGRLDAALATLRSARATAHPARTARGPGAVSARLWASATLQQAALLIARGDPNAGLDAIDEVVPRTDPDGAPGDPLQCLADTLRAKALLFLDRLDEARTTADAALSRARRDGDIPVSLRAAVVEGATLVRLGEHEAATARLEHARQEALRAGLVRDEVVACRWLGLAVSRAGAESVGQGWMAHALTLAERAGLTGAALRCRVYAGWAAVTAVRPGDLESHLAWCTMATDPRGADPATSALSKAVHAALLLRARNGEGALPLAESAVTALSAGLRLGEGEALARWALADALRRLGRIEHARAEARALRDRIGRCAEGTADPTRRERFLRAVPEHQLLRDLEQTFHHG